MEALKRMTNKNSKLNCQCFIKVQLADQFLIIIAYWQKD